MSVKCDHTIDLQSLLSARQSAMQFANHSVEKFQLDVLDIPSQPVALSEYAEQCLEVVCGGAAAQFKQQVRKVVHAENDEQCLCSVTTAFRDFASH